MVKFSILNREKSNSNPTQYKKKSSLGLLIARNRILIQPNIRKVTFGIINHQKRILIQPNIKKSQVSDY
jgi:hypothetical protein